jgi:nitroimidazol reductase NimA-like FMN-containing flavoprotein (pyridoxamine 5'-phosphate oxidase superfamily)
MAKESPKEKVMSKLPVCSSSQWSTDEIEQYLQEQRIPVRLSCNDKDGFPLICSLWFVYHDGYLWCATHENAAVAKLLEQNPKCAFEVAINEMPYKGVRGKGTVELLRSDAEGMLKELIARYLGDSNAGLASWLLSRSDHEYAIKIAPSTVTSWDFSERMSG